MKVIRRWASVSKFRVNSAIVWWCNDLMQNTILAQFRVHEECSLIWMRREDGWIINNSLIFVFLYAMSNSTIKDHLNEQSSTINCAKEILQIMSSEDLLQKTRERKETMRMLRQKIDKAMDNLTNTTKSMLSAYYYCVDIFCFCLKYWRPRSVK